MDEQTQQPKPVQTSVEYPVVFEVQYPQTSSRWLALLGIPWMLGKVILVIPHLIILYFLQIAGFVVAWIGFWAILFTGKYPQGMFNFVVGFVRWQTRITAYMLSLTDKYPPFSLK